MAAAVEETAAAAPAAASSSAQGKPVWFTLKAFPHVVCKKAPQQKNEYDCGVYMLGFIEEIVRQMASAEGLPSFAEAETLVDHFSERMFSQEHITDKRRQLWNVLRDEYKERHGVELGLDA